MVCHGRYAYLEILNTALLDASRGIAQSTAYRLSFKIIFKIHEYAHWPFYILWVWAMT